MKNILILTTHYALDKNHSWLVDILAEEMAKNATVHVVFMDWKGSVDNGVYEKNGVKIYSSNLIPLQGGGIIRKSLKWLFSGDICFYKYKEFVFNQEYDCVIAFAPVIVYRRILKKIKNKSKKSYLILWDFFPDYHSQLGLINKNLNFLFNFIEQKSYSLFDRIGVMSQGNIDYFKRNKKLYDNQTLEVLPLWGPRVNKLIQRKVVSKAYKKFVFGGQLIKGRGLDILIEVASYSMKTGRQAEFYIFGDGPERKYFENKVSELKIDNIYFKGFVPRDEYFEFLISADVGLVFNSGHVTVPTYPSKAIDFYRAGLPILAYVEEATDFGDILEKEIGAGLCAKSSNKEKIFSKFDAIMDMSLDELFDMGSRGRKYFDEKLRVDHIACKLIKYIEGIEC